LCKHAGWGQNHFHEEWGFMGFEPWLGNKATWKLKENFPGISSCNIRVIHKVLQTGGAGPLSSAKTGDEIKKVKLNKVHRRKTGSNWFSHLISFTPSFGFALPAASLLCSCSSLYQSLIRLASCKSWPNAWFHWNHTQFYSFFCYMKIGDETGGKGSN
jgi:hypothetical protein